MRANAGKAASSSCFSIMAKPSMPGLMRKHLKPATPASASGSQVSAVLAGQSAPRRPVDPALAGSGDSLGFERSYRRGFRKTIQGHIHQRGISAGGCGASGGREALPFRSAWFVDVHMRIHQPGQEHQVAECVQQRFARGVSGVAHRLDAPLLDHDRGRPHALRSDHPAGDKSLCHTSDIRAPLGRVQAKMNMKTENDFMQLAIRLATENVRAGLADLLGQWWSGMVRWSPPASTA